MLNLALRINNEFAQLLYKYHGSPVIQTNRSTVEEIINNSQKGINLTFVEELLSQAPNPTPIISYTIRDSVTVDITRVKGRSKLPLTELICKYCTVRNIKANTLEKIVNNSLDDQFPRFVYKKVINTKEDYDSMFYLAFKHSFFQFAKLIYKEQKESIKLDQSILLTIAKQDIEFAKLIYEEQKESIQFDQSIITELVKFNNEFAKLIYKEQKKSIKFNQSIITTLIECDNEFAKLIYEEQKKSIKFDQSIIIKLLQKNSNFAKLIFRECKELIEFRASRVSELIETDVNFAKEVINYYLNKINDTQEQMELLKYILKDGLQPYSPSFKTVKLMKEEYNTPIDTICLKLLSGIFSLSDRHIELIRLVCKENSTIPYDDDISTLSSKFANAKGIVLKIEFIKYLEHQQTNFASNFIRLSNAFKIILNGVWWSCCRTTHLQELKLFSTNPVIKKYFLKRALEKVNNHIVNSEKQLDLLVTGYVNDNDYNTPLDVVSTILDIYCTMDDNITPISITY